MERNIESARESNPMPVACRGGADGATAPGIHLGGIQEASFR